MKLEAMIEPVYQQLQNVFFGQLRSYCLPLGYDWREGPYNAHSRFDEYGGQKTMLTVEVFIASQTKLDQSETKGVDD
jgi:hypothetical protein